jgi:hypothetical protein
VAEVKVDALGDRFLFGGGAAVETGRYLDARPTLLLSDGAIDAVYP